MNERYRLAQQRRPVRYHVVSLTPEASSLGNPANSPFPAPFLRESARLLAEQIDAEGLRLWSESRVAVLDGLQ